MIYEDWKEVATTEFITQWQLLMRRIIESLMRWFVGVEKEKESQKIDQIAWALHWSFRKSFIGGLLRINMKLFYYLSEFMVLRLLRDGNGVLVCWFIRSFVVAWREFESRSLLRFQRQISQLPFVGINYQLRGKLIKLRRLNQSNELVRLFLWHLWYLRNAIIEIQLYRWHAQSRL